MKKGMRNILIIFGISVIIFLNTVYAADYHVTNCQQLQDISPAHLADNVYLDNDITDCSGRNFVPIGGDYPNCFSGFFYGNGKKISNLNQNQPNTRGGLFGLVCGGTIQDVGLENVNIVITNGGGVGNLYVGALAGEIISLNGKNNVIQRVYAKGLVTASSSQPIAGGLIGFINWNGGNTQYSITNSYAQVNVNAGSGGVENIAGGLIGKIYGLVVPISCCYSSGTVNAGTIKGGLIGDYEAVSTKPVSSSFWDTQTSGLSTSAAGTGKTTAEMKQSSTFSGCDFYFNGINYPRQQWECNPSCTGKNCGEDNGCGVKCIVQTCTDSDLCTDDLCTASGTCTFTPKTCAPGLICISGTCQSTLPPSDCPDDDTIMKLYQPTNSHGALYNDATNNYQGDVCYSEIFGIPYAGPITHACAGQNKLINLYSATNSHGESFEQTNYNAFVCYGDLQCRKINTAVPTTPCTGTGERIVLSLYQDTNSHISKGDDLAYPIKICCRRTGPEISQLYWANILETPIIQADLNDRVKLIATGAQFDGKSLEFNIVKQEGGNLFDWLFPDRVVVSQSSLKGFTTWIADQTGDYYFTVTVDGVIKSSLNTPNPNPSGVLHVSDTPNNNAPFAKIDNPKNGEVYDITDIISFRQLSYDEDDYIDYVWDFGDGNSASGSTRDYVNYNLSYSYATGLHSMGLFSSSASLLDGQKNVLLSVTDERGLNAQEMVSILAIDRSATNRIYVFANISIPSFGAIIPTTQLFDATGSYAIQIVESLTTPGTTELKCIGGFCPEWATNRPAPGNEDYSLLNFIWKFNDLSPDIINKSVLKSFSSTTGWKTIDLTVNYTSGEKSSTYVMVFINPGGPAVGSCSSDGTNWIKGSISYPTIQPNDKCLGLDDTPLTNDDCCPTGGFRTCQLNTSVNPNRYQCMLSLNTYCTQNSISSCSDYDQAHCVANDQCGKGTLSCQNGNINNFCGGYAWAVTNTLNCRCQWDSANNICIQNRTYNLQNNQGLNLIGSCATQITNTGECQDGEMSVTQNSQETWDNLAGLQIIDPNLNTPQKQLDWVKDHCKMSDICFTGTRGVICGEDAVKLSFFNWINLVIVFVIMFGIYFVWIALRKRGNKGMKKNVLKKKR